MMLKNYKILYICPWVTTGDLVGSISAILTQLLSRCGKGKQKIRECVS